MLALMWELHVVIRSVFGKTNDGCVYMSPPSQPPFMLRSSIDRIHELVFSQREVGEDGVPLDAAGAPVAKKHGRSKQI